MGIQHAERAGAITILHQSPKAGPSSDLPWSQQNLQELCLHDWLLGQEKSPVADIESSIADESPKLLCRPTPPYPGRTSVDQLDSAQQWRESPELQYEVSDSPHAPRPAYRLRIPVRPRPGRETTTV